MLPRPPVVGLELDGGRDVGATAATSGARVATIRARRLRARRSQGVVMVAPVEVGQGGVELLVGNGLLKQHQADDRHAVGEACLAALEQWSMGRGARTVGR